MPVVVPGNLPAFQFLVAFNNNPLDDPGLITTVASPPGTLGANNVWTDIGRQVRTANWGRGRQHEMNRFETGNGTVTLTNEDGKYNPWNTSSPYTGKLTVMKPFRIQATPAGGSTYVLFTGLTLSWVPQWPTGMYSTCQLSFVDAFDLFNILDLVSTKYASTVISDGATGYWKLNEPPGSLQIIAGGTIGYTIADSAGTHTGYVSNVGQSAKFGTPGPLLLSTDTAVDFGNPVSAGSQTWIDVTRGGFSGGGSFSVEAWVKTTSTIGEFIVSQASGPAATTNTWSLSTLVTGGSNKARAQFGIQNNAGTGFTSVSTTDINDGLWHHLVGTFDGTTVKMYLDNVLQQTPAFSGTLTLNSANPTLIGSFGDGTTAVGGIVVGQVAFYSGIALTAGQVNSHYLNAVGFAQSQADQVIGKILDVAGWAAAARSLDPANSTIQANTQQLQTTKALGYMQTIEQTEGGALFMDRTGKVRFVSRTGLLANSNCFSSQATFGDQAGELPILPGPQITLDDVDLWNDAVVQRVNGLPREYSDATSKTSYGTRNFQLTGQLHISDDQSLYAAQWVVSRYKQPLTRLRQFSVNPRDDTNLPVGVLARDLTDRVTINRHSPPGGGTAFTTQALIEKISHTVDFGTADWRVDFAVSPTDAQRYWILGDTTYGVLDTTTVATW